MRIGEKGQVTIPIELREALGLFPGSTVEFDQRGSELVPRKTEDSDRGRLLVERLRGRSTSGMSTEQLIALTRR
jgi:AbrB family looped-hinge helix DNA binding protein